MAKHRLTTAGVALALAASVLNTAPCLGQVSPQGEALPALGETLELPPLTGAPSSADKPWLTHYIALDSSIYPGQLPEGVDRAWFELSYRPRLAGELGAGFALTAEALLRASAGKLGYQLEPQGEGNSFRLFAGSYHNNPDRTALLFKETTVSWAGKGLELAAGYQIFSWGKADGVRPLDVFRVEDLSDPLRAEQLGLPSLSASYGLRGFTLEGVWVPFLFTHRLAVDPSNPWSITPRVPGARFADARHDLDLGDGELGFRLTYSDQAWDLALQASRTNERSPSLLRLTPQDDGLLVTPQFRRQWIYGASLVRAIDRFLLKADVAYVDYTSERARLLEDGVRMVAGGEARGQLLANGSYMVVLQYALDTTTPGKLVRADDLISSPYHWFKHAALGKARALFSPRLEAELSALVELLCGSTVISATLTYHPKDGISLWCEGSFLAGPQETWIGRIDFADRMVVGMAFNTNS